MFVRRHYAFQLRLNSLYNSLLISRHLYPRKKVEGYQHGGRIYNCYALIELSGKTIDEQAVIFTCLLNNNSSNVFLLAKTGGIVK